MYENNADKFARLRAIASDQNTETATVSDTREESEISSAVSELIEKTWLSRHLNRAYAIKNGDTLSLFLMVRRRNAGIMLFTKVFGKALKKRLNR